MGLGDIADSITRQIETLGDATSEALFEPVIRIGVTGLSRAGKTVFITSLVANLMNRARMHRFTPEAEGRIEAAFLQPQPDDTMARFDFERHLADMTGESPTWPASTRATSQLRLSFRLKRTGLLKGIRSARTVHLDIVDYPGEWLLDLSLLDLSYKAWSAQVFAQLHSRPQASAYLKLAKQTDATDAFNEPVAQNLAKTFALYLQEARADGFSDCTPGRFLLPGDLEDSPVLTFAPLLPENMKSDKTPPRKNLLREMERRFEAYKSQVVKPFFRDHFSKIDRQIVLVDVLGAIHTGPVALENLRNTMADILRAFRPGKNAFLSSLLLGRRVDRILFAATKADHLHHTQHPRLSAITQALLRDASDRANFAGAQTHALSISALRTTIEERLEHQGRSLDCVRGRLLDSGKSAAFYPGELPEDPARLLQPARDGAQSWLDAPYEVMRFAPLQMSLKPNEGPAHMRLDQVAEFLLGDLL